MKWLRLGIGVASVVFGLMALLPAPHPLLWMIGVGITDWGHLFALAALVVFAPGWRSSRPAMAGAALGALGAVLALTPILRAMSNANEVASQVRAAFGDSTPRSTPQAPPRSAPFSLIDAVIGIRSPSVGRRTVEYSAPGGEPQRMDVYLPPERSGLAPCVITIHGGSWRGGDREQLPQINTYLAARGYVVAAIDYRLAPRWPFPAALDDVRAALRYLREHAAEFGIDATKIALFGRSAGGHLALLAGYEDPAVRAVIAVYPPTDLVYAHANPSNPRVLDSTKVLEDFMGGSVDEKRAAYIAASPIHHVGPTTPATLLIHGARDEIVYAIHSEFLAERLAAAGRPHLLLTIPWGNHGCDANLNGPGGQAEIYAIERMLAAELRE